MAQTLEISDELYDALTKAAEQSGTSPVEWIAAKLPRSPVAPSGEEVQEDLARLRAYSGAVDSGNPRSADNEQIDADLLREYGDDHACLYRKQ